MRLISAVLGFVLRKLGVLGALVATLFLGYLAVQTLVPPLREAAVERERLQQVAAERAALEADLAQLQGTAGVAPTDEIGLLQDRVATEIDEGRRAVDDKQDEVQRLRTDRDEVCNPIQELLARAFPGNACAAAQRAVETADAALDTIERSVDRAQRDAAVLTDSSLSTEEKLDRLREGGDQSVLARQVDTTRAELEQKRAEERSLRATRDSPAARVVDLWSESWRWLVGVALLILLLPPVLRTVSYFVLMPLVRRAHTPIRLAAASDPASAALHTTAAQRTLTIELDAGEVLSARSEHVRPVQGKVRSRLLYDWTSPFISFAAGLYGLSRITGDEGVAEATLATPDDPDSYLMRIEFEDHPGLVMRPRHVVGITGTPTLETRWRWGLQSLATRQVRYILFAGTGSLIVQGSGDVVPTSPGGRSTRMEQHLVMGFDSRLTVGVNRTEVFWPYLWGRTSLVDDEFTGHHPLFWQKSSAEGAGNPLTRTFNAFFSALGKLLGF